MGILVNRQTRVLCQGITGKQGSFYTAKAIGGGTNMVGGVTPGKGGQVHLGLPVFDSVADAREQTGANATVVFVPPASAANAVEEAIKAEIELIVCVTERIPGLDVLKVKTLLEGSGSILIGPNCPGVITPGECAIGIMPHDIFKRGRVGIISRASTLTYEVVAQTSAAGLGQSTCTGIGADPLQGLSFTECLQLFATDESTDGVIMIGEIGGNSEEDAARYIAGAGYPKPVVAYVAGRYAPTGRRMGHAGAIIEHGTGDAESKIRALVDAGVHIVESPVAIGQRMAELLR